jgi:hypothetical protein
MNGLYGANNEKLKESGLCGFGGGGLNKNIQFRDVPTTSFSKDVV